MSFIWQISKFNFVNSTIISGVILHGSSHIKKIAATNAFVSVISSYLKKPYSNKEIEISIDGIQYHLSTNNNGSFFLELDNVVGDSIEIFSKHTTEPLKIIQSYPIVFKESNFPLSIISDIDDTILVSYTSSLWKRISTLLFVAPHKRKPISFTREILNKIDDHSGNIHYVSKSESNLFSILTTFIENKGLPKGDLKLTPYLKFIRLLNSKKGKYFKEKSIRSIIDHSTNKKFILMGDDTQQDIAVYTRIVQLYPKKIFKIYIRKTQKSLLGNKKKQLKKLKELDIPMLYFTNSSNVLEEIKAIENYQNQPL